MPTPTEVFVADFEQYAADAKASMEAAAERHGKGDPVYLVLEGIYHDRKSAADQVKGFVQNEALQLNPDTLATAINDAQVNPDELLLGKDLRPVAERILAALERKP